MAVVNGTNGNNTLNGTAQSDTISGLGGNDRINALAGDDTLIGGPGNDTMDGGADSDTYQVAVGDGFDLFQDTGSGAGEIDQIVAIAVNVAIGISGSFGAANGIEIISAAGFGGVTIQGDAAADTLDFSTVTLTGIAKIDGGAGNDTITGSSVADAIAGGAGNDMLKGGGGNDTLTGGPGNDTMDGGAGSDTYQVGVADGFDVFQDTGSGAGDIDQIVATVDNVAIGISGSFGTANGIEIISAAGFSGVTIQGDAAADNLDFSAVTLTGIAKIDGGAGNDTITGSSAADAIAGGAGNDMLKGGAGNDTLIGGAGNDTMDGGSGSDTYQVGVGDGSDIFQDTGSGAAEIDQIVATANNVAIGISGSFGAANGIETISAGGFSGVTIQGDSLADTLDFSAVTLTGITKIDGGAGNDTITASSAADAIAGGAGNDTLKGDAGNDTLIGGTGNDTMDGGAGSDTYQVGVGEGSDLFQDTGNSAGEIDQVVATAINVAIGIAGNFSAANGIEIISSSGFSGVTIQGDSLADTLDFSAITLTGIAKIDGGGGNDTVTGSSIADAIAGGTGNDILKAGGGNDTLSGGAGNDTMDGGAGSDTYQVAAGDGFDLFQDTGGAKGEINQIAATAINVAIGISGNFAAANGIEIISASGFTGVTIQGDAAADKLDFSAITLSGISEINGGGGNDTITGSAGNDKFDGGPGSDTFLVGPNAGFDSYADSGPNGIDRILASADNIAIGLQSFGPASGIEQISANGHTNITIQGDVTNDAWDFSSPTLTLIGINLIDGGGGNDTISGTANNDTISGGANDDALNGLAGNDTLIGGPGNDTLDGGDGSDTYLVGPGDGFDSYDDTGATGTDVILASANNTAIGLQSGFGLASGIETISANGHTNITIQGDVTNDAWDFSSPTLTLIGINLIDGAGGNDTIAGTANNDVIAGGANDDALNGLAGNDTLIGGSGNDTLDGGDGSDTYLVGPGDGFDSYADSGLSGTDRILATADNSAIGLQSGFGSNSGIETISANGHSGVIIQGDVTNVNLDFSTTTLTGIVSINGGDGTNLITGSSGDDVINGGAGIDNLSGGAGADCLSGNANDDSLSGGAGNDTLIGGLGNDNLDGGDGSDTYLVGPGDGFDSYFDSGATGADAILATADNTAIGLQSGFGPSSGIESINANGHSGVIIEGNSTHNSLDFSATTLIGIVSINAGDGTVKIITGSSGDDVINGGAGEDILSGGAGADCLSGNADSDSLTGGANNDTLIGGPGNDSLDGGDGSDTYWVALGDGFDSYFDSGAAGTDVILAAADNVAIGLQSGFGSNSGIESISANGHSGVIIQGDVTDDNLDFSATTLTGIVSINAGDGNDTITGSPGNDTISGGQGFDAVDGYFGDDTFLVAPGDGAGIFLDDGGILHFAETNRIVATADNMAIAIAPGYVNGSGFDPTPGIQEISADGHVNVTIECHPISLPGGVENAFDFSSENLTGITEIDVGSLIDARTHAVIGAGAATVIVAPNDNNAHKLVGSSLNDDLQGGAGNDTLIGGAGSDILEGGAGSDTYYVGPGDGFDKFYDTGAAFSGVDRILATAAGTVIGLEADTLDGPDGAVPVLSGIEEINANNFDNVTIAIHATSSSIVDFSNTSLIGIEAINGSNKGDNITGSHGADTISGGGGNDTISGGPGLGFDTAVFAGSVLTYQIAVTNKAQGIASVQDLAPSIDGDDGTDSLSSIEALRFKDYTVYLDGRDNAVLAVDDTVTANQDTPRVISAQQLLANDFDFDNDPLQLEFVSNAINGTVALNAAGDVVFTPTSGFSGNASFIYALSDGRGSFDTGTVAVTVLSDRPPVAQDDTGSTDQNTVLNGASVLGNDSDPDAGDVLSVSAVNGDAVNVGQKIVLASGAFLTVDTNGTYSYDPNGKFQPLGVGASKTDSFDYTVSDGRGGTADATVTITVNGVNDDPVAVSDAAISKFNKVLHGASVLTNDHDPDKGDVLSVSAVNGAAAAVGNEVTLASGAKLTVLANGTYSYDPNNSFPATGGIDSFTYSVSDGHGGSASATVNLTISADTPVAGDDHVITSTTLGFSTSVAIPEWALLRNDTPDAGPLQIDSIGNASGGTLSFTPTNATHDLVSFTTTGFNDGSFTYDATDGVASTAGNVTVSDQSSFFAGNIVGTNGDDILVESSADNPYELLDGKGGNDILLSAVDNIEPVILRGGPGDDIIVGRSTIGFALDYIDFSDATGPINFTLHHDGPVDPSNENDDPAGLSAHVFSAPGLGTDTYYNIGGVIGTAFDDSLSTDGTNGTYFDISAGGNDTVTGAGNSPSINEAINAGAAFNANDQIDGGSPASLPSDFDELFLDGDYSGPHAVVFTPTTLTNVEDIVLASGHSYSLTTDDATVRAGSGLEVDGEGLGSSDTIMLDARAEQDGSINVGGGGGNDTVFGGQDVNSFSGFDGNDIFYGGQGLDQFSGGAGNDTFVVGDGSLDPTGVDNFFDFHPHASGDPEADTILIHLGSSFDTFDEIKAAMTEQPSVDPSQTDTIITFSLNNEVRIWNTHIADLSAEDFGFAPPLNAADDNIVTDVGTDTPISIPEWALLHNDSGSNPQIDTVGHPNGLTLGAFTPTSSTDDIVTVTDDSPPDGSFSYRITDGVATSTALATVSQDKDGFLTGTNGDDILIGNGDDTMHGGAGNDVLLTTDTSGGVFQGGPGNDVMIGGGDPNSIGGDYLDFFDATGGLNFTLVQSASPTVFNGSSIGLGFDTYSNMDGVIATDFNDMLTGSSFADSFAIGLGNDTVYGGDGNDAVYALGDGALTADDQIDGEGDSAGLFIGGDYSGPNALVLGPDTIKNIDTLGLSGSGDTYDITMNDGNVGSGDALQILGDGVGGDDYTLNLDGSAETDGAFNVQGSFNNDTITGGAGEDTLSGGGGADQLFGGDGADSFVFNSPSEGGDTIGDFTPSEDHIVINASNFGGGLSVNSLAPLEVGSTPTASGASFFYNTDDGKLYWDPDGAGVGAAPVLLATLVGIPDLNATDFMLI